MRGAMPLKVAPDVAHGARQPALTSWQPETIAAKAVVFLAMCAALRLRMASASAFSHLGKSVAGTNKKKP